MIQGNVVSQGGGRGEGGAAISLTGLTDMCSLRRLDMGLGKGSRMHCNTYLTTRG